MLIAENEKICIREIEESDKEFFLSVYTNKDNLLFENMSCDKEELSQLFNKICVKKYIYENNGNLEYVGDNYNRNDNCSTNNTSEKSKSVRKYIILELENNSKVGFIDIHRNNDEWHLGIVLLPEIQNKGYAKSAVLLFLDYYYKNIADRIYACCASDNKKAIKSLERNGFNLIGIDKGDFYYMNGKQRKRCDICKYMASKYNK